MSETWAYVVTEDVGVSLTTVVAGIPLALRHARTASRAGWTGIRFVLPDQGERERVRAVFERHPAPEDIELEVVGDEAPARGHSPVYLQASAIYLKDTLAAADDAEPSPDFRITGLGDLASAQRFLFKQIRKSIALDGVIAYYIMRPLARLFTRILLNTQVSPNQATLAALACGIGAAVFAGLGSAEFAVYAGVLYWFGGVLDCIDGELARLRLQSSKIGEWLDSMVDEFSTIALILGLGIGLRSDGHGDHWMLLGMAGALVAILTLAPMYVDLHRQKLAIDTAQFPWFFGTATSGEDTGPAGPIAKLINVLGYFIRRDANITGIALFLLLNLREVSLIILTASFGIASVLVITHYSVLSLRKRAGSSAG